MWDRTFTKRIIGWCNVQKTWQPIEEVWCGHNDCYDYAPNHKLRKRWAWVCDNPDCQQAYFDPETADDHECGGAY